jgi:hypothetical protein
MNTGRNDDSLLSAPWLRVTADMGLSEELRRGLGHNPRHQREHAPWVVGSYGLKAKFIPGLGLFQSVSCIRGIRRCACLGPRAWRIRDDDLCRQVCAPIESKKHRHAEERHVCATRESGDPRQGELDSRLRRNDVTSDRAQARKRQTFPFSPRTSAPSNQHSRDSPRT